MMERKEQPAKAERIQGRWAPGVSGNPKGKPKGCRHSTTKLAQELLQSEALEITRKCIEMAKAGDPTAIRLVLERLIPQVRKEWADIEDRIAAIEASDAMDRLAVH